MKFITRITEKLQTISFYPFEEISSSNIFVSSVLVNGIILIAMLVIGFFTGNIGVMLSWLYGSTQVFGLVCSIIMLIKFNKLKKETNDGKTISKTEYNEANAKVGFIFYWIVGVVVSTFIVAIIYSPIKLML